jgi:hypothetical protein
MDLLTNRCMIASVPTVSFQRLAPSLPITATNRPAAIKTLRDLYNIKNILNLKSNSEIINQKDRSPLEKRPFE